MPELGERLRQLRVARGLSQSELGDGRYSGSYISHIESGRRHPGPEVLGFLAERLGLAGSELDGNDEEQSDTRLTALLAASRRALALHDWDGAVRVAQQAAHLAQSQGRQSRRWESEMALAVALMASGRYCDAAELSEDLAGRPVVAAAGDLRAEARTLAARAARASGRLADSARLAALAVQDAADASPELLAEALVAELGALVTAERMADAAEPERRLRELTADLEPAIGSKVAWAIGNAAFARGEIEQGLDWHLRGADLSDPQVDARGWARLRLATAHYLVDHDVERAQDFLDQAQPIVMVLGNAGDIADLRLVQARALVGAGRPQHAVQLLTHLCGEAATLGDVRLEGELREALASALQIVGENQRARDELRRAAICFEEAQAPERALSMWHQFAAVEA